MDCTEAYREHIMYSFNGFCKVVIALGAGLGVWGVINLLEGYGNDNLGANPQLA